MPIPLARPAARRLAGCAALAWTVLTASAGRAAEVAAEVADETAEHAAGLPQLDPTAFAPQLVWLAITFAVLYVLMSRVALPKVAAVLEERQERITEDLDKAEALREEANAVLAAYEKAVADARGQAQAVIAAAAAEISASQATRQAQFAAEIAAKTRAAEARIDAAKEQALSNVRAVAVEIAQAATERLAGIKVDAAAAEAAVGAAAKRRA